MRWNRIKIEKEEKVRPRLDISTINYYDELGYSEEARINDWELRWSWIVEIFRYFKNKQFSNEAGNSKKVYTFSQKYPDFSLIECNRVFNGVEYLFNHKTGFFFKLITQITRAERPDKFRIIFLLYNQPTTDLTLFLNQFYTTEVMPDEKKLKSYWIEPNEQKITFIGTITSSKIAQVNILFRRLSLIIKNYFDPSYKKRLKEVEAQWKPKFKDVEEI